MPDKPEDEAPPAPAPIIPEDLTAVTDKELGELEGKLQKDYTKHRQAAQDILDGKTKAGSIHESASAARAAVDALTKVREESTRRAQEREQIAADLGEMDSLVNPPAPEEEPEDEAPAESEPETPEATAAEPPKESPKVPPAPKAVAASAKPKAPSVRSLATQPTPKDRQPEAPATPTITITAAGDVPHFSAGQVLGAKDLGHAMTGKIDALYGPDLRRRSSPGRYHVATLTAAMPQERALLASASASDNGAIIEQFMGREALEPILASGGICNPVEVDYSLVTLPTRVRPVTDSLTRFPADRGGIRFMRNARLANVASGIDIWTAANDEDPSDPATKPCVTVTCPSDATVEVDAITLCIEVGNFDRRFFPEHFDQWYELARAQHARVAETKILDAFLTFAQDDANGGWSVFDPQNLGAAPDLFATYDRAASAMRSRNRMDADATVQVWLPETVPGIIRTDILRQHPGDGLARFAVTMAQIREWFTARNISVTWYKDSETGAGQFFGFQGAGDPEFLQPWPASAGGGSYTAVIGYMTFPGLVGFLDGGTLDLGIDIRDSTLNATNDVQAFLETFEGVFWRGLEFGRIQSRLCIDGSTSAAIDIAGCAGS